MHECVWVSVCVCVCVSVCVCVCVCVWVCVCVCVLTRLLWANEWVCERSGLPPLCLAFSLSERLHLHLKHKLNCCKLNCRFVPQHTERERDGECVFCRKQVLITTSGKGDDVTQLDAYNFNRGKRRLKSLKILNCCYYAYTWIHTADVRLKNSMWKHIKMYCNIKGTVHSKMKIIIIDSASSSPKPVWVPFFCWT